MVELSSVLSDLRRQFGIAPGADVPRRLVAEAITRRLSEQAPSASEDDGTGRGGANPLSPGRPGERDG